MKLPKHEKDAKSIEKFFSKQGIEESYTVAGAGMSGTSLACGRRGSTCHDGGRGRTATSPDCRKSHGREPQGPPKLTSASSAVSHDALPGSKSNKRAFQTAKSRELLSERMSSGAALARRSSAMVRTPPNFLSPCALAR